MSTLTAAKLARRPYDSRNRRTAGARRTTTSLSAEMKLIWRALNTVARLDGDDTRGDYAVSDVRTGTTSSGVRGRDVVFLEQRLLGLPVYGGRRSVILGPRARVTGARITLRAPSRLTPTFGADAAARKAVAIVTGRRRLGASKVISASPGPERTSAIEVDGLNSPITAHLALFGRSVARLAWVLTLSLPDGDGFELVVDATSLKLLRRRQTIDHATACLAIDAAAGGPAAGQPQMPVAFDAAWIDPADRNFECVDAAGTALPLPGPNPQGNYCNAVPAGKPFQQKTLNGFALVNAGFDLIEPFGGQLQARVALTLLNSAVADLSQVAFAKPDLVRPLLKFMARHPSNRHAASDPSVVLHELGHLVLSAGVGGSQVANPFEMTGESAAVNEGLADFLGLTLWNAIRRTPLAAAADVTSFAQWVFESSSRDYTPFFAAGATVPTFPSSGSPHKRGMVLCTALLRARRAVEQATSAAQADAVMLSTLCASLAVMPHQGDLPQFCCVSAALRDVVPLAHRAKLESALNDANIPNNCPHIV